MQCMHIDLKPEISVEMPETVMFSGLTSRLEGLIPWKIGNCMPLLQLCYELALQMFTSAASGRIIELPVPCFFESSLRGRHRQHQVHHCHLWQKTDFVMTASIPVAWKALKTPVLSLISSRWTSECCMWSLMKQMCVSFSHKRLEIGSVVRFQKFPRVDGAGKIKQDSWFSASTGMVLLFPVHLRRRPMPWIPVPCKHRRKV